MQGNYEFGTMQGKWETWHENGEKKSLIEYTDGLISGKNNFWYPNGKQQLVETYKLVEIKSEDDFSVKNKTTSVLHGAYGTYNIRGIQIISGNYENGLRNGKWVYRNNSGNIIKVENYKMDKPDGKWQTFYDFGGRDSEVNYKDGMKEGKSTYWNQKGEVIFQAIFHGNRQTDVLIDKATDLPSNR
jgi:antitoxin component YwqK of YwqJK toxin-antitoxin module